MPPGPSGPSSSHVYVQGVAAHAPVLLKLTCSPVTGLVGEKVNSAVGGAAVLPFTSTATVAYFWPDGADSPSVLLPAAPTFACRPA